MQHAREGEKREEYLDPIDVAYIFGGGGDEEDGEDILQAWMNKNKPTLDEHGGPSSRIADEMGVDVGEFTRSRSGKRVVGRLEDPPPRDDIFDLTTQSHSKTTHEETTSSSTQSGPSGGGESGDDGNDDDDGHMQEENEDDDTPLTYRRRTGRDGSGGYIDTVTNVHVGVVPSPPHPQQPMDMEQEIIDLSSSMSSTSLTPPQLHAGDSSVDYFFGYGYPTHGGQYMEPEPYTSSTQWPPYPVHDTTPSPTKATTTSYQHEVEEDSWRFPRMGVLLHASEMEYQRHIIYWKQYYNHMSWERYMMQLLDEQAQQAAHDNYAPSRHSAMW